MMKNRFLRQMALNWTSCMVILSLCLPLGILLPAGPALAAEGNSVKLEPSKESVPVGEEFNVKVILKTVENTDSFGCCILWNGNGLIECTGVGEGTFYNSVGQTMIVGNKDYDPYEGWTEVQDKNTLKSEYRMVSVAILGDKAPAKEDTVLNLKFKAREAGDVNIQFVKKKKNCTGSECSLPQLVLTTGGTPKLLTIASTDARITVTGSGGGSGGDGGGSSGDGGSSSSPDKPNLIIEQIDPVKVNNTYTVNYKVTNRGGVKSGDFRTGLYISDNGTPYATEDVKSLEPNASYSGAFNEYVLNSLGPEDVIKVWADDNGKLTQGGNDDHYDTWPYYDVIASKIDMNWIEEGQTYEIKYKIKNLGSKEFQASNTGLLVNGKTEIQTCPALAGGEEYEGKFGPVTLSASGADTVKVCADTLGVVEEAREDNNCQEAEWPATGSGAGQPAGGQSSGGQPAGGNASSNTTQGSGNTAQAQSTVASAAMPQIPETRPATPGITISWDYIGGFIGLIFLVGLLGYVFGRLMTER